MATKDLTIAERELINGSIEFLKSLTIKNPYMVKKFETVDSAKWADNYLYICDHRDEINFEYFTYTIEDYKEVGINNNDLLKLLSEFNQFTPDSFKDQLLENKLNLYERDYIEYNDYYRMLNGLPPYEAIEADFIYVKVIDEESNQVVNKPIHTLTNNEFYQIESNGTYKMLLDRNPTLQYLYYINPRNKISFYTARKAKDFHIMGYNGAIIDDHYVKEIIELYYQILVYTMAVIYSKGHSNTEYYDSYLIIYMLTATLQKFFAKNIENLIRRDVYDLENVKNIYASYGLTFFEDIPLKYQRKIVKNMNKLLSYKGTDKIFVDLADIFGFSDTELYKYYLIKDFRRDESGKPISLDDSDPRNIELKFAQVSTSTNDVSSYLKQDFLYQTYEEVVGGDPYWGEEDTGIVDEEFINEIKGYEFNYVATKYLSLTTVFNMSECAYETTYFFNYLNKLFKEGQIDNLYFYNTAIKDNGDPVYLYDAVTALYILLFRRFGYKDTLPSSITGIASVYGFNFDKELSELKDYIKNNSTIHVEGDDYNYWWKDPTVEKLTEILELPNNPTKAQLLNDFFTNKKTDKEIEKLMLKTDNYRMYRALNSLHNFNMYSEAIKDIYGENYGTTESYDTFTDWLRNKDSLLLDWVNSHSLDYDDDGNEIIDKEKTLRALDDLLDTLEMYFTSNQFTNLFTNMGVTLDLVKHYFLEMISIFKAYTVELKMMNIYYLFNDKFLNSIKIFSYLKQVVNSTIADSIEIDMEDDITVLFEEVLKDYDLNKIEEYIYYIISLLKKDIIHLDFSKLYKDVLLEKADSIEVELGELLKLDNSYSLKEEDLASIKEEVITLLVNNIKDIIHLNFYDLEKEVNMEKADSIEENISEALYEDSNITYFNKNLLDEFKDSTITVVENIPKDKIDTNDTINIREINSSLADSIEENISESLALNNNRILKEEKINFKNFLIYHLKFLLKEQKINIFDKDTYKAYHLKNADLIAILDEEHIRTCSRAFNDYNKFINCKETLDISYSYVV